MSTEQVYTSMQQGMINAIWTIPTAIKSYSWWDLIKYGTLPYIAYPDSLIVVNAKWWTSLPQEVRDTVLKVVPKIEKDSTDFVMDDAKAILEEFVKQKGGTISTLSAHDIKTLKEICVEKVYPVSITKYDPAFWSAIAKEQGLTK
jgi:TRAP-type C4-dicarboxylate transport system substrate-binding protein